MQKEKDKKKYSVETNCSISNNLEEINNDK